MITCRLIKSRLERSVITGTSDETVARHISMCSGCRAAHAELTQMHQSLSGIASPLSSVPTTEMILARIIDVQRVPSRTPAKFLAACGAVVAMLFVAFWLNSRPVGITTIPPIAIQNELAPHKIEYTPIDKKKARLVKSPVIGNLKKQRATQLAKSEVPVRSFKSHGGGSHKAVPVIQKSTVLPVNRIDVATQWAKLGESYESEGDYASAANAYRMAGTQNKQFDYVIGAGRNSESAGQVESAIEIYADLLSTHTSSAPQGDQGAG